MTWIAACSGQRGTYQETIMTDEERQKLVRWLRNMQHMYGQSTEYGAIADEIERLERELNSILGLLYQESERRAKAEQEIERLAARVNALEHIINLDMYEATKIALVQAQDEIERLAARIREFENRGLDNRPLTAAAAYDASKIKTHTI